MVKSSYGAGRLNRRKLNIIMGSRGTSHFRRIRRIKISDFILLMIPLLFLLILNPPKEPEEAKEKVGQVHAVPISNLVITVYNVSESIVDEYSLEEYLVGVVAAEMPSKAVAARTFALSRKEGLYGSYDGHFGAAVCTDPSHCQAWVSKKKFLEIYGDDKDWEKIKKSVADTEGIVMTYAGKLINPLYHSNSGGVTEDIDEVWAVSGDVPYLKSVYSPDESQYSEFEKKTVFSWNEMKEKVKHKYAKVKFADDPCKDIEVTSYSASGRVDEIRIGSMKISGTGFRELLSLRSTNLDINVPDKNTVEIISKGYGHGVGMSQCGADVLGKKGQTYSDILEYYYTGVDVEEVEK